ncbi:neurogenic locus notch homolog protein 1-like [Argiope bruennichi]|nr:neurogenic locus notch homolog protein 1-like [Argiope bruennichi]
MIESRFVDKMKYFIFLLILCLGFFSERGLSEKLVSKQQSLVGKSYNLYNDEQNQGDHIFEDPVRNYAECQCKNGNCVEENGKQVCRCPPGFGNYTSGVCKACDCGPDSNCMWIRDGWLGFNSKKVCLCKPGYYEVNEKCIGPCSNNPCKNGGTCKDVEKGYECVCTSNYTGKDCIEKVTPCTFNPCKNDGNCTVLGEGFTCNCPKPYTGLTCETDPCTHNPCKNNGTCKVDGEEFKCSCVGPWKGNICEHGPCDENPCQNDGTCKVGKKGYICTCKPPYSGPQCQIGPCDKQPCQNGGTCKVGKKGYICTCKSPYSGPHCQNDPCTFNPCKNSGQCQVVGNLFKCTCIEPWTGETCEENSCTFNPCKNSGQCQVVENQFKCTCIEPWTGETCEKNPCTSYPCKNGGACKLNTQSFSCDCVPPFQGELCEIGPCSWNPCQNEGICSVEGSGFKCICKPEFKGILCEIAVGTSTSVATESSSMMTTVLTSTIPSCYCGPATESCQFDSFGEKNCICSPGYIPVIGYCTECKCGANQDCFLKANNEPDCSCIFGYVEKLEDGAVTCLKCNCHETQICFVNDEGNADCRCASGQIEKIDDQGVKSCLSCYCPHEHECHLDESGNTACRCPKGKIEQNIYGLRSCVHCYCHETQECFLNEAGSVNCRCPTGYIEKMEKGVKTCIECDCGVYGICSLVEEEKKCTCAPSSAELDGKCVECDCGLDGLCRFESGQKKCVCRPKTIERDGKCVAVETSTLVTTHSSSLMTTILMTTIASCSCGENSKSCAYNWDNKKICECLPGYAVKDVYCFECNCGPHGSCKFVNDQKKCSCAPFTVEMNGVCVDVGTTDSIRTSTMISTASTVRDCTCGHTTKTCRYNVLGEKECTCYPGYAVNQGYCEECNCGPYGSCSFEYGRKRCNCKSSTVEKHGLCVVVESTTTEKVTTRMPTTLPPTTRSCSCGENSKSCTYNWDEEKICECFPGYAVKDDYCFECNCGPYGSCKFVNDRKKCSCAPFTVEMNGVCVDVDTTSSRGTTDSTSTSTVVSSTVRECDCGINARSCFYRRNGDKVCNCDFGYIEMNGYCSAICSEEKCVHGKCKVIGNGFKCRCNVGFTGPRCEDKIETKSNKLNLWMAMQFTITFAIFLLLSGMFCFLGRMLNKNAKK